MIRTLLGGLAALALRGPADAGPPAESPQQQEETIFIDEVKKDFLDKITKCEQEKQWKALFEHYTYGLKKYAQKVVAVSAPDARTGGERWTSVNEFLIQRLSRLPKAAYEYYRLEYDGPARAAFDKARESGSRREIEKAVEDYFFSSHTDEALDQLANTAFDEGRVDEAASCWNRLLRYYPDADIPRAVTAARIANACRIAENEASLADLRRYVVESKLEGTLAVGGVTQELRDWLGTVQIAIRVSEPRPLKSPYALEAQDLHARKVVGVRNDIKRWTYDFAADREGAKQAANPTPEEQRKAAMILALQQRQAAPPQYGEYPVFPAHARLRGRDYVLCCDGTRFLAVDPARVKGASFSAGVYWKYPAEPILRPTQAERGGVGGKPYVGVAVDGEYCYTVMYSKPALRIRDNNPQNYDFFEGTTAVKCLHIPTGRLVWDTDQPPVHDEVKKLDFYDRNFSFSGAPIVRGDRVFVGICTSPMGEQESRVLCLDRRTGRPLWSTFLASASGGGRNMWGWGGGRMIAYQTMMVEQGGVIYAHTNLGVMAALNPVSGSILWLSKYKRSVSRGQNDGGQAYVLRPANWPVVWRGHVFVLAQDRIEMLAFDKLSGRPVEYPSIKTREGELDWKLMTHLVGAVDDWMVVGGTMSHVIRLKDYQAYSLASSNTSRTGLGIIHNDLVYLPATSTSHQASNQVGVLAIYDTRTWKSLDQPSWKDVNEYGNLLIAGDYLVVATNKLMVYTDVETLRGEFVHRLHQSPPHAPSLHEFGEVMRENDRLEEAAEAYLAYIKAAEGDPEHVAKVGKVKRELHGIFMKRGEEAEAKGESAKSLEFFAFAKEFSFDEKTRADSTRRVAETFEKLQRWKEAVAQYQELVEKARGLYHREADQVGKLWEHARGKIEGILAKAPDAYEDVEKQAQEALRKAKEQGADALKDVMDRFPNSKTARDAWQRILDALLKEGRFDKLRSWYNDFKDRFKTDLDFDSSRKVLEFLEKLGDTERLRWELGKFAARFEAETVALEAERVPVKDWVARRLAALDASRAPAAGLRGPLRKLGEMESAPGAVADPLALDGTPLPLLPLGVEPPALGKDRELFSRGSSVELWDLTEKRRLWSCPHPGGWLGVTFADVPGSETGVVVQSVKPDSPAAKARLERGDVLLALAGEPIRSDTFSDRMAALTPGTPVELTWKRGDRPEILLSLEPAAYPAGFRPAIVGAAYTRDYSVAVAWEDGVASIDLATGRVQWTFRGLRDRFHVRAFHATDGRLYVYEGSRVDRDRDPFRGHSAQGAQKRQVFLPADSHHRLLCLNDFTGEVAWARPFECEQISQNPNYTIAFFGRYLADHVVFLQALARPGATEWVLWQLAAQDGATVGGGRRSLVGQVIAWTADVERGAFYYVADLTSDRRERYLYNLPIDPAKADLPKIEVALHPQRFMPQTHGACTLAAGRDYICLLVPPPQDGADHRLWVFKADTGKEFRSLSLLPDRTLSRAAARGALMDAEGLLYVYNVPRGPGPAGRAYLTAFRVGGEPADLVAWDAPAPVIASAPDASFTLGTDSRGFAVFAAPRATAPGQAGESGVVAVYDRAAEGYLHMVHSELSASTDPAGQSQAHAAYRRGRLYLGTKQALQIYGD